MYTIALKSKHRKNYQIIKKNYGYTRINIAQNLEKENRERRKVAISLVIHFKFRHLQSVGCGFCQFLVLHQLKVPSWSFSIREWTSIGSPEGGWFSLGSMVEVVFDPSPKTLELLENGIPGCIGSLEVPVGNVETAGFGVLPVGGTPAWEETLCTNAVFLCNIFGSKWH